MVTQHTAGEWHLAERAAYADFDLQSRIVLAGDRRIAAVHVSDEETEANAHLIAAAPMLLEALKLLKERLHEYVKLDVRKHAYLLIAHAAAGTAIAKAEGKL